MAALPADRVDVGFATRPGWVWPLRVRDGEGDGLGEGEGLGERDGVGEGDGDGGGLVGVGDGDGPGENVGVAASKNAGNACAACVAVPALLPVGRPVAAATAEPATATSPTASTVSARCCHAARARRRGPRPRISCLGVPAPVASADSLPRSPAPPACSAPIVPPVGQLIQKCLVMAPAASFSQSRDRLDHTAAGNQAPLIRRHIVCGGILYLGWATLTISAIGRRSSVHNWWIRAADSGRMAGPHMAGCSVRRGWAPERRLRCRPANAFAS